MKAKSLFSLYLLVGLSFSSCQYSKVKKGFGVNFNELTTISYQTVDQAIFRPNCYACHGNSGGINLQSYNNVVNNIDAIERAIKGTGPNPMPPAGPLSANQIALLELWIQEGMPLDPVPVEGGGLPGDGDPVEPPPPLLASYTSLKVHIFSKCIGCHSAEAQRIPPLHSREAIIDPEKELVDFNRPERSELVKVLEKRTFGDDDHNEEDDDDAMPPVRSGIEPVSPEEIETLIEWIRRGAPE